MGTNFFKRRDTDTVIAAGLGIGVAEVVQPGTELWQFHGRLLIVYTWSDEDGAYRFQIADAGYADQRDTLRATATQLAGLKVQQQPVA